MNERLFGPPQHERHEPITWEELYLNDDHTPLWYALVEKPNVAVLPQAEADKAKSRLVDLYRIAPKKVLACRNMDLSQARKELERVEEVIDAQSQMG